MTCNFNLSDNRVQLYNLLIKDIEREATKSTLNGKNKTITHVNFRFQLTCLLTLGSEAKYSIKTEGTSAKSMAHLVPVTNKSIFQVYILH